MYETTVLDEMQDGDGGCNVVTAKAQGESMWAELFVDDDPG